MKIPSKLTPKKFVNMLDTEPEEYHNSNELLGDLSALTNQLHMELHRGGDKVTTGALKVLVGIGNLTIKASKGYIHA